MKDPLNPIVRHLRRLALPTSGAGLTDGKLLELFLASGDEAAFEALLRKHGPMVFGVCRRVLANRHDAEDALQATFLLLARKADCIWPREQVGNWLYGVAYRTALKARSAAAKRRLKEQQARIRPCSEKSPEALWPELLPILDRELSQLPDKYRVPIVLCDLEGKSRTEAARQTGWPVGTVSTRLARGRALLAKKLRRAGLGLSAGSLAALLLQHAAAASLTPLRVAATVKAASLVLAGKEMAGAVSAPVVALMEGVLRGMFVIKLKLAAVAFLPVVSLGMGAGLLSHCLLAAAELGPPAPAQTAQQRAARPAGDHIALSPITRNFVVDAPTPQIAQAIGRAAERYRKEKALAWLGKELPAWSEPLPIRVRLTVAEGGSATTFTFAEGKMLRPAMQLQGTLDRLLQADLPHELTHVILAQYFGSPVPRWADEGAAVLSADQEEQKRHDKAVREILSQGKRFIPLRQLFDYRDYPTDALALFAEGYSVTRFLVESANRATFLTFVAQGMREGWDQAAQHHYHYANIEALETAWRRSVQQRAETRSTAAPPSPTGGAPPHTKTAFGQDQDADRNRMFAHGSAARRAEAPKDDKEKLQGSWQYVLGFIGEYPSVPGIGAGNIKGSLDIVIDGDHWIGWTQEGKQEKTTFRMDATKTPKALDLQVTNGAGYALGIYRLEGDSLMIRLCSRNKQVRPAEFVLGADGDNGTLLFYKRVAAQPSPTEESAKAAEPAKVAETPKDD